MYKNVTKVINVDLNNDGEILKREVKLSDYTIEQIAGKIGISRTQVYRLFEQQTIDEYYKNAFKKIGIDLNKLVQTHQNISEPKVAYNNSKLINFDHSMLNMILIPAKAYGGFIAGYENKSYLDSFQHMSFPFIQGTCYAFEVEDFSMFKSMKENGFLFKYGYEPGMYVVTTQVENFSWLRKDKDYVFQCNDKIIINRFNKTEKEHCHIYSINEEYNPVPPLHLKNINRIYQIERTISKP
ncbi:MAG TPA: helix-turn-helix transcriptional regulator [Bacteroidia bacterium]|nr:helix-turn-helix transcriptional regulator [Bacteroidia bacterium]